MPLTLPFSPLNRGRGRGMIDHSGYGFLRDRQEGGRKGEE